MNRSLLPPNSTAQERAIEQATLTDIPVNLADLWNSDACPIKLLPWLAWSLSVDEWDDNWSEEHKRNTVKSAFYINSKKGAVASVRRVLAAAGYGDVDIVEGLDAKNYSGEIMYDGSRFYGPTDCLWAMYRIYLRRPISIVQAAQVRQILAITAPARCKLEGLHYTQALNLYDNNIFYNGEYSHGVA